MYPRQRQPTKPQRTHNRLGGLVAAIAILLLAVAIFYNRQFITDLLVVQRFQPSAHLEEVLTRTHLSDKGKFYVYASQTDIVDRTGFNNACGSLQNEKTVVLGCYTTKDQRIYVYDVTDQRLAGVREATTAHEMLHAAYDRLTAGEKERVARMVDAQARKITDPRLLELIDFYKASEPDSMTTELHSIFATEVLNLDPELDAYYSQYFSDRSALVRQQQAYEKVFSDLRGRQQQLVTEMNTLSTDISAKETVYMSHLSALNSDIASFNSWAQSGQATRSEFNVRRATLESRIASLETERNTVNSQIDAYNSKRAELEQLNMLAEDLNRSIDSKLPQLPSTPSI